MHQDFFPYLRRGHTEIRVRTVNGRLRVVSACADERCMTNQGSAPHHDQAKNRAEWLAMVKAPSTEAHSSRVIAIAAARDTRIKAKSHAV